MNKITAFYLQQRGEQLICQQHRSPIFAIKINKSVPKGERLCCQECSTFGDNILFLSIADKLLQQWQQEWDLEWIKFKVQMDHITQLFQQIDKLTQMLQQQLKEHFNNFQSLLENRKDEIMQNELSIIINKIDKEAVLNATVLQELAELISKQEIIDGKLKYTNQSKIYPQIQDILEQITNILNNVIENFKFGKQSLANQFPNKNQIQYKKPNLLEGHSTQISAVAISCDDKFIASGASQGQIILWDLCCKKLKQLFQGDSNNGISDLIFTQNLQYLAAAQFQYQQACDILLFKIDSQLKQPLIRLKGHNCGIWRIGLTQDAKYLLSISADKTLKVWDVEQKILLDSKQFPNSVKGLAISQNQQFTCCICENGSTTLFDSIKISSLRLLTQWKAHDYAYSTIFTPDSEQLITCSNEIKVWSIKQLTGYYQKSPIRIFKCDSFTWSAQLIPNGTVLITYDNKIKFWEFQTGQLICSLKVHGGYSNLNNQQFAVTSDMSYVITGNKSELLKIYQKVE